MIEDEGGDEGERRQLRAGHVLPVRAGGPDPPTRGQARGPRWRSTSHGFYVPVDTPADDVDQRIVEASVVVPPRCAINGWANLRWRGGRWFDGRDRMGTMLPVDVVVSTHDIRPQRGIRPGGESFRPGWVTWVDGLPLIDAAYAVSFVMRYADSVLGAATALSLAAYNDLVSVDEVSDWLTPGQNGMTGVPQAREAIGWAEENVWAPDELWVSWVWQALAGMPRPLCNVPVFDRSGRHVATPDLLDPVAGVAGEYDGGHHLDAEQRGRDVRREGLVRHHGLEVVTATKRDRPDPRHLLARLHDAYHRASHRPRADRTWTIDPPTWWTPSLTVEQRRALTPDQRRRLLGHREIVRR
ncbi:hypothetical protein [Nocardioides litoris]|uniref:hypothetical protein n=1 Tax=Nocardioides litoris TaxID=1926648 RepID=UPI00112496E4|nr:hypothetical protein [Nocardioides litoris]